MAKSETDKTALQAAQDEFISLFVTDVEDFPHAYKKAICEQPTLHAIRLVVQLTEAEVRQLTRNLKAERAKCAVPRTA